MWRNVLAGIVAGAAGTTALNALSFMDMAVRARPASTTPADTVHKTEQLLGLRLSEEHHNSTGADNRRSALGALLGIASGLSVGGLYGLVAPRVDRAPVILLGVGAGVVANVGTTGPMVALGITDPRTWSAGSWLADLVPHLAYGLATAAAWDLMRPGRPGTRRLRPASGSGPKPR